MSIGLLSLLSALSVTAPHSGTGSICAAAAQACAVDHVLAEGYYADSTYTDDPYAYVHVYDVTPGPSGAMASFVVDDQSGSGPATPETCYWSADTDELGRWYKCYESYNGEYDISVRVEGEHDLRFNGTVDFTYAGPAITSLPAVPAITAGIYAGTASEDGGTAPTAVVSNVVGTNGAMTSFDLVTTWSDGRTSWSCRPDEFSVRWHYRCYDATGWSNFDVLVNTSSQFDISGTTFNLVR